MGQRRRFERLLAPLPIEGRSAKHGRIANPSHVDFASPSSDGNGIPFSV
jgi:hypothetical protein